MILIVDYNLLVSYILTSTKVVITTIKYLPCYWAYITYCNTINIVMTLGL
jgi:hypothetical protein